MSVNYTEDQVKHMVEAYTARPERATVEMLAEDLNKSIKSIIGKLSREGVYEKTVYKTKTGEDPVTKKELVEELSELVGIEYSMISGLEKSPKIDLKRLVDILKEEEDAIR
jgi:ppGpp synthetase/RelA/SpoT-type nucleotidyltranferase